ncbi:MAG: LPS export ABC transporter permease LptG [Alphaproteobacteria bacterium]
MRLSTTLSLYIARQFFMSTALILAVMIGLVAVIDTVELLRRASGHETATFALVVQMALLHVPHMMEKIIPFAMLFGSMLALNRLTRSHELVVARAAGVSVWQFLLPGLVLAFLVGVFVVTVFNPLASATTWRYEQLESKHLRGRTSLLAVSSSGLWLREGRRDGQSVIHALRVAPREMTLQDVIMFVYEGADRFTHRLDAESAKLEDGYWQLHNVLVSVSDQPSIFVADYRVETQLTPDQIHESFASPETMSFWELPDFIKTMQMAGFSALRHRLHWNSILAIPLLLCAMVLIAATCSLRLTRRGGTGLLVLGGLLAGFLLYFLSDVVLALGMSASIPVVLAAWAPGGMFTLLGLAMLLHFEDG